MSVNSILSKCKYCSDIVKLQLVESHCLPIIMYAIESLHFKSVQLKEINSWWNSVYRKIFSYNKWESVRELICLLGRLDILHLENLRRLAFIKTNLLELKTNPIMKQIVSDYSKSGEFTSVLTKHRTEIDWSLAKIKAMMFVSYKQDFCSV
jgi:hypothetical protein